MTRSSATFRFVIALVAVWGVRWSSAAENAAMNWRIRTGTDLTGEQFHLVENDTVDFITELRTQLQAEWTYPGLSDGGQWRDVALDNRVGIGTQTLRYDFTGRAVWLPSAAWRMDLRGLTLARYYLDDAGGTRSDVVQGRFQATAEHAFLDEHSSWGIDQGIEGTAYGTRSSVFLNGIRHWHGFVVDGQRNLDFYGGRIVFERERIPDSTGLDYAGISTEMYGTWSPSLAWEIGGDGTFDWRRYRDTGAHPHERLLTAHVRVGLRFLPDWSAEVNPTFFLARYAPADSIFYNVWRATPTLSLIWWPEWGSVRGGPTWERQRSGTFPGEDYTEWGGQIGVNLVSMRGGFFDLMTQLGRRNYRFDAEALFSDYWYWDTTLLVTTRLPWNIQLDAFIIYRDEYHSETLDNSRSVLLTVDLSHALGK